jgi:cell division protein FtsQ
MFGHLRTAALALAGTGVAGAVAWVLFASPWLRYTTLTIEGAERSNSAELRHLAHLPTGAPLVQLDLDAAVAGVGRHPWVKSATARRQFPNGVLLTVVERTPVALLSTDRLYLVDEEGVAFARAQPGELDLPVLSGFGELAESQPELSRRLVREGLDWIAAAEARGGLHRRDISELHFDADSGYALFLRNGGEVLLGFAESERVARLTTLAAHGVDLAVPHRVDLVAGSLAVVTPL